MKIIVADRIKDLMISRGMNQVNLAKALEISEAAVSYWLSGQNEPSIESLWKLADFFDVDLDYLVGRKEFM